MKPMPHNVRLATALIVGLVFARTGVHARDCRLNTNSDFVASSPLLLNKSLAIVRPTRDSPTTLTFNEDDASKSVIIANCPGSTLRIDGQPSNSSSLQFACSRRGTGGSEPNFRARGRPLKFDRLSCDKEPEPSLRAAGNCSNGRRTVEIGFATSPDTFAALVDLCFDERSGRTAWAHARIQGGGVATARQVIGQERGFFRLAGYFKDIPVSRAYARKSQRKQLLEILGGDRELVDLYIPETGQRYFAKGHLVARADMFYKAEQSGTYYYVNTLPMWQVVNNGNWRLVEDRVRRHAEKAPGELDVWSGGLYDLDLPTTMPGDRHQHSPMRYRLVHLSRNTATGQPALVVPRLLFKAVYSRELGAALVYVTANDPYMRLRGEGTDADYIVCKEVEVCWKEEPRFERFESGYTYCCLYGDFLRDPGVRELGLPELGKVKALI